VFLVKSQLTRALQKKTFAECTLTVSLNVYVACREGHRPRKPDSRDLCFFGACPAP